MNALICICVSTFLYGYCTKSLTTYGLHSRLGNPNGEPVSRLYLSNGVITPSKRVRKP